MTAIVVVSSSEIQKVIPDFSVDYEQTYPEDFKKILWNIGLNTNSPYERQDDLTHRNRLNEVVTCSRWVGLERLDSDWVNSKYSSREARLDSSGSQLVRDLDPFKYERIVD